VKGTPHEIQRTKEGFVVRDQLTGHETPHADVEAAIDQVEQHLGTDEDSARARAELAVSRAEREASKQEREQASQAEKEADRERRRAEFNERYPVDEEGRRYYHRLESPTQDASVAGQQESSSEIWGRAPTNTFAGSAPKVQAYMGRLPDGAKGVEFVTDHPVDPGTPPGYGTWSAAAGAPNPPADDDATATALRVDGEFAKLRVKVIRNTQR
jgi:hypothetical protein